MELVLGIILLVMAVFLVIAVLMQSGKEKNLSGTIAGGAETFFGKSKANTVNKKLSILTTIVAIIFVILVIVVYVIQDDTDLEKAFNEYMASQTTEATETTAAPADDTTAAPSETTAPAEETTAAE